MKATLNEEQLQRLAAYERYFGMAIRSGFCSAPPTEAIDTLQQVWAELTGKTYPVTRGCSVCIFNLIRDMGQLYYTATGKDPYDTARVVKKSPVSRPSSLAGTAIPAEAKSAPKAAKKGKNEKK